MYKVCGKMYSRAGHEASQPASHFLSFFFLLSFLSFFLGGEKDHHT